MINEETLQKMTLKSTLDFLWIHCIAALIGCYFILQMNSPAYIRFIAWIGIMGAIFGMIKGTFARLDLDPEGSLTDYSPTKNLHAGEMLRIFTS